MTQHWQLERKRERESHKTGIRGSKWSDIRGIKERDTRWTTVEWNNQEALQPGRDLKCLIMGNRVAVGQTWLKPMWQRKSVGQDQYRDLDIHVF